MTQLCSGVRLNRLILHFALKLGVVYRMEVERRTAGTLLLYLRPCVLTSLAS